MPAVRIDAIHFYHNGGEKNTEAELYISIYNEKERLKRAMMRLGLFWLLSLGSIPIIFAHWVLVPGFFIAGPIAAIMTYRVKQATNHASGRCPCCEQQVVINLEPKDSIPSWTYCPQCKQSIHLDH
ncbi:MAG: hypothetical protein GXP08_06065 [Gammaproteobacteria bacterium]|nr:hypothetical protein [Gammaproteobacteria bacterium]